MVASSTSPSYCPHFTDEPFFVLLENDKNMFSRCCSSRLCYWLTCFTYTSPSGVYFEPEMSNWPREMLSPSTLSMMNICMETWHIRSALYSEFSDSWMIKYICACVNVTPMNLNPPWLHTSGWWWACQSCRSRWLRCNPGSPPRAGFWRWRSSLPYGVFPEPGRWWWRREGLTDTWMKRRAKC